MSAPVSPHRPIVKSCVADMELACSPGETEPIGASLRYDSRDPWAVTFTFHEGRSRVDWIFSRDLLNTGVLCASGAGDITVAPHPHNQAVTAVEVTGRVGGEETHATFFFKTNDIAEFLCDTWERVPSGQEDSWVNWRSEYARLGAGAWE